MLSCEAASLRSQAAVTRRPPYCPCLPPVAVSPAPGAVHPSTQVSSGDYGPYRPPRKPQGRRAGFCTYDDLLDNAGSASADRMLPEYQHLQVGDWMPMAKKISDTTTFKATAFETSQWLLWQKPDSTCAWKLIRLDIGRMEQSSTVWCPPGR